MKNYLFLFLILFILSYVLGLVLSAIKGKKQERVIDISSVIDRFQNLKGPWWVLVPFVGFFVLIYNIGVIALWFIEEVLLFLVVIIRWIWLNVFVAGGYFLFQLFWHYIISWPWKIFIFALNSIRPSLTLKNFKIAILWLFVSFLIAFVGKYIALISSNAWISTFMGILSIIPIGIGLSKILTQDDSDQDKNHVKRYTFHLFFLIGVFFCLIVFEFLIIYLASFSDYSYLLSALVSGGSIAASIFIIINSFLLLFGIIALPSFSKTFSGSNREMLFALSKHLLGKWAAYLLGIPMVVIPAILLCLLPYLISQGASKISGQFLDAAYSTRIDDISSDLSKSSDAIYMDWLDQKKYEDNDLKQMIQADRSRIRNKIRLISLESNMSYMHEFYGLHSSNIATLPVIGLMFAVNYLSENNQSVIKTSSYNRTNIDVNSSGNKYINDYKSRILPDIESQILTTDKRISQLNEQLALVCKTVQSNPENATGTEKSKESDITNEPKAVLDPCELRRMEIKESIEDEQKLKINFEKQKIRAEEVANYLLSIQNELKSSDGALKFSEHAGFLLVSVWFCLIMSFAFCMLLPVFSILNQKIHNSFSEGEKWFIVEKFEQATQLNRNQPYLGLLLFLPFSLVFIKTIFSFTIGIGSYFNWDIYRKLSLDKLFSIENISKLLDKTPDQNTTVILDSINNQISDLNENIDTMSAVAVDTITSAFSFNDLPIYETSLLDEQPELMIEFEYDNSIHIKNGAPEETYVVQVSFVINPDGSVQDVSCSTNHGYGIEDEVIAKIESTSGNWKPGIVNTEKIRTKYVTEFKFGE
jgi:hypothetical protein